MMDAPVKLPSSYSTSKVVKREFLLTADEVERIVKAWVRDQMDSDDTAVIRVSFESMREGSDARATIRTESRD